MKRNNTKRVYQKKVNEEYKKAFPVFRFIIVVVCILFYATCLYAGISGEIDFLQVYTEQHKSKDISGYRWMVIGVYSAGGFMICIDSVLDAFNLLAGRKSHKMAVFTLGFVLPTTVLVILNFYRSSNSFFETVFCIAIILILIFLGNISDLIKYIAKNIKK